MENTAYGDAQRKYRTRLFSVQGIFSTIRPFVTSSKSLALNAEINAARIGRAGDAFSVVARELGSIMNSLSGVLTQQEVVFSRISRESSEWMKSEHRLRLLNRTLDKMNQTVASTSGDTVVLPALAGQSAKLTPGTAEGIGTLHSNRAQFEALITREQGVLNDKITGAGHGVREIEKLLERMNQIAVRQSHFTAIAANVEAARTETNYKTLGGVARSIREFASGLAQVEAEARQEIGEIVQGLGAGNGKRGPSSTLQPAGGAR